MEAATGRTQLRNQSEDFDARFVAIRHELNNVYRFLFLTPASYTRSLDPALRATMDSFRKLTDADRSRYNEWKIEIQVVKQNDSVASLSRNMPMPGPKEKWFRVLNGMETGTQPTPGQMVKVVVK